MATKPVCVAPKASGTQARDCAVVGGVINACRRFCATSIRRAKPVQIPAPPAISADARLTFARIELHTLARHARRGRTWIGAQSAFCIGCARLAPKRPRVEPHAFGDGRPGCIGFGSCIDRRFNGWDLDGAASHQKSGQQKKSHARSLIFGVSGASKI